MKTNIVYGAVLLLCLGIAYLPFSSQAYHRTVTISVDTDQEKYEIGENIEIEIKAKNNSSQSVTLEFNGGCQVTYEIETFRGREVYNHSDDQICTMALTSVTIPANSTKTWTITHDTDDFELDEGEYVIVGEVIGYGRAYTEIEVEDDGDSEDSDVELISPNGGEKWKLKTSKKIRWQTKDYWYFWQQYSDEQVDIYLVGSSTEYLIEDGVDGWTYKWKVGRVDDDKDSDSGDYVRSGTYKVKVCLEGTNVCDSSNSSFRISGRSK